MVDLDKSKLVILVPQVFLFWEEDKYDYKTELFWASGFVFHDPVTGSILELAPRLGANVLLTMEVGGSDKHTSLPQ